MTFLIDVSGHQAGLDMRLVKPAGNEAVIVKAVAAYLRQHTVAEGYQTHIDNVIAAGLPKGHYAVPNSENTPAVLAKFLWDNRHRPSATDVYMLDNEPLDAFKVYWRDDNAAAFFEALHELGARYDQMWLYCPAALTRAAKNWPKIIALRAKGLKIVWVSYGDNDPYREDGEEPFTGETGLDDPEVHQFTSTYRIAGYDGNLDRNYSPLSVAELFRGDTMQNPWGRVTGTWEDHASYSEGGTDWPLAYGTALRAPASGWLVNNGWVGTAGRRGTLTFDQPVKRILPPSQTRMLGGYVEHNCDMVALVFQHAKGYLGNGHYDSGALIGYSGASASGLEYGGDVHLHAHGLCAHGARVDFMKFVGASTASGGGGYTPIEEENDMAGLPAYHWGPDTGTTKRGGVLLTEHLGPIFPPNLEYAQKWKAEYPPAGGVEDCDIDARTWDVLVQSARDRKALFDAALAAAGGGDPAVIANKVVELIGAQLVAQVVNATRQQITDSLKDVGVGPVAIDYAQVEARAEQAIRDVLGGLG